jgi:hypothetical protein
MYQLVVQADELRERYGVLPLGGRWGWREPGMENGEWRMEIDRGANS